MRPLHHVQLLSLLTIACGHSGASQSDAGSVVRDAAPGPADARPGDGPAPTFALTSPAIHGADLLDAKYTCAGTNSSPPMSWTAGPVATSSYAVVFRDNTNGLVHSVIWDIPGTVHSLSENVENTARPGTPAGARQAHAYDGQYGYSGPCPGGEVHDYEFELIAVNVATVPGLSADPESAAVVTALAQHTAARAKLAVRSNASPPP